MTYQEAEEKSFTVEWKLDTCSQGESCWCRVVKPVEPILYMDGEDQEEYWLVPSGNLDERLAEYLVKLHNEKLKTEEPEFIQINQDNPITKGSTTLIRNPKHQKEMNDRELGQFLNWFIRHYSTETTTDRGLMFYANSMGEEVSIADILEHYNKEK